MRKTSQMNSRNPKKFKPIPAKFIIGILMILFAITGCSDMPYTGSNPTVFEVNRYLVSTDGESVCFQGDIDATCIRLIPETQNTVDANSRPAVYIYPERRVYMLYHEGAPILRAERAQIVPTPPDTQGNTSADDPSTPNGQTGNNNGNNGNNNNGGGNNNNNNNGGGNNGNNNNNNNGGGNNGNNNNNGGGNNGGDDAEQTNGGNNNNGDPSNNNDDGHGWIIWVYYPEGASPPNAPTLSESGVTVTINGSRLTDEDIAGFAQFIGSAGERGVQFFYPTESAELLDLKIRIEGVVSDDETVKFNINYLWNSQ
ncbi:MAG: hypothetical protein OXH00_16415 [Candidatus Poribacteria bacterium]|nr:hypothetical protein [Candidatus Poribacteria bacterium]